MLTSSYHVAMIRSLIAVLAATFSLATWAQNVDSAKETPRSAIAGSLNFEGQQPKDVSPTGWNGGPEATVFADNKVVHGGHWSARLERHADSPSNFSALNKSIPMDFTGQTVELRGFLRTEDVSGFAGLWMREDGERHGLAFDNMQDQGLRGTTEWKEYSIKLAINSDATQLFFGVLLSGTGKMWADDLQLLVDGKPVWEAAKLVRKATVVDLDHKFDGGSGISLTALTNIQISNLATLGKVWGFLKYHHPQITSGQHHWDYDLFRVLPTILAAPDGQTANAAMLKWTTGLGEVAACSPCARLDENDLYLKPSVEWIADTASLGKDLSQQLNSIYRNRPALEKQFYVSLAPNIGNPVFQHELAYKTAKLPDPGFQLLALYRFWNIIQYWFPYRDVMSENWDKVLVEFIPRITLAKTPEAYQRELIALIARAHDTHANLWSSLKARPPVGDCQIPVNLRFIENRTVVAGYAKPEAAKDTGLNLGDVITEIDDVSVSKLIADLTPYYAASNDSGRMNDMTRSMTNGNCGEANIRVLRDNQDIKLKTKRVNVEQSNRWHDLPGETFRLLSKDVAYLKLSSVKSDDAKHYVESAAGTKGLIIDIRNYPSNFMVFALGSLLVQKETQFARYTTGDLSTPGAFHWGESVSLTPAQPHYGGKIVIIVDEVSLSSAEYTSMAFRSAPGAVVVGSTTAGADGNVSPIPLPAGVQGAMSGIGVFYPDKKPTQRVGIIPDVVVRPTIAGIRAGRDEVLEAGIREILGKDVQAEQMVKMYREGSN